MALKVVEANGCQKRSYPVLLSPLKAPVRPAESVTFAKAEGSGWAYLVHRRSGFFLAYAS